MLDTIGDVSEGTFEGGGDTLYDVGKGGVGYREVSPDAPNCEALIETLEDVSERIGPGEIDIPRE